MRKALGKLLDAAGGDHAALLATIKEAAIQQPDEAIAWIRGAVQARAAPLLAIGSGPRDPPGIRAWIARQPDVETSHHNGLPGPSINGNMIEISAELVADAAGLPEAWRGNWDAMGNWLPRTSSTTRRCVRSQIRLAEWRAKIFARSQCSTTPYAVRPGESLDANCQRWPRRGDRPPWHTGCEQTISCAVRNRRYSGSMRSWAQFRDGWLLFKELPK